ncbi:glycoside hydrolase family 65 protein [Thermococcus sp.]
MRYRFSFDGYSPEEEAFYGTILTLGNGYLGIRGEVELEPSLYGTTIAGVYDYAPYFYREIVNAPRAVGLRLFLNGEPLSLSTQRIRRYERELDIGEAVLRTEVEVELQQGGTLGYESVRIVHGSRKEVVILKFRVKPGRSGTLTIISPINTDTVNPLYREEITAKHYRVKRHSSHDDAIYTEVETTDGRYRIGIASSLAVSCRHSRFIVKNTDGIAEVFQLDVEEGKEYEFIRYAVISYTSGKDDIEQPVLKKLRDAKNAGFDVLYREHREYWQELWSAAEVRILGDEEAEKGLLFSLFHLMQCMPVDSRISLTARGIHGFGYRGHVFWDTEIYALPFFMAVFPEKAREMLVYRYNNLDAARENARANGYRGAQFPWESADDGYEATPPAIPTDMTGKNAIRIYTGEEEHHITADIAYAVELYYRFTGDNDFMEKYGLEIIFETARFWASRVRYDKDKGYVIEKVIGPDEYHEHVNNSFFTNMMARYNLLLAARYLELSKENEAWSRVAEAAGVTEEEAESWRKIAEKIYIPRQMDGIWEEFDGYFELLDYTVDPYGLGEERLPAEIREHLSRTKLVKQADVIALQYLLKEQFDTENIRKNFDYYLPRTTHASSLSMPTYAIIASWLGYDDIAYNYFMKCAYIDLHNLYGNTKDGFHLATAGGLWQILFRGFCGVDISGDILEIRPNLPQGWEEVALRFRFRGSRIHLRIRKDRVAVKITGGKKLKIRVFNEETNLEPEKEVILEV